MALTESIGEHQFVALHGNPEPLKELLEVLSRPGVDGNAIWKKGSRGVEFTLRSVVDTPSFAAARATYKQYLELIDADPVGLTWSGIDMEGEKFEVKVLDVRPVVIRGNLGGVGGKNPPSRGWVEADWRLLAVNLVEEE